MKLQNKDSTHTRLNGTQLELALTSMTAQSTQCNHCPVTTVHIHSATVCFPLLSPSCNFTLPPHHMVLSGCQLCVFFSIKVEEMQTSLYVPLWLDPVMCLCLKYQTLSHYCMDVEVVGTPAHALDISALLKAMASSRSSCSCCRNLFSRSRSARSLSRLAHSNCWASFPNYRPQKKRETERSSFCNMESTSWLTVYLNIYFQCN